MDWTNIAFATVAVLGPYFSKAGESAAKKVGEDLYLWLKKKFEDDKDDDSQTVLEQLKTKPDSEARRNVLAEVIAECAQSNPDGFGTELQNRVQKIASSESNIGSLVGQIIAGKVSVVNTLYGNITM